MGPILICRFRRSKGFSAPRVTSLYVSRHDTGEHKRASCATQAGRQIKRMSANRDPNVGFWDLQETASGRDRLRPDRRPASASANGSDRPEAVIGRSVSTSSEAVIASLRAKSRSQVEPPMAAATVALCVRPYLATSAARRCGAMFTRLRSSCTCGSASSRSSITRNHSEGNQDSGNMPK